MAKFIDPRKDNVDVQIRTRSWKNIPVNIDIVQGINKTTKHFYSDPNWSVDVPAIEFVGTSIWWVYPEHGGQKKCDRDYNDLMNSFGSVLNDTQAYLLVKTPPNERGQVDMFLTLDKEFAENQYAMGDYVLHYLRIFNP